MSNMIKSWKVSRTPAGIMLTLNGEQYNLGTSAHAILNDLQQAGQHLNVPGLTWNPDAQIGGTSLRGYLTGRFPEMLKKLQEMSGQSGECDGDKVTIEFVGTINGESFTIYDYKGSREPLHIGGHDTLNLKALGVALANVGVVSDANERWK